MSGGGMNDFFEEKCAPVRRPSRPPSELPNQLKPKFPKPNEPSQGAGADLGWQMNSPAQNPPSSQPAANNSPKLQPTPVTTPANPETPPANPPVAPPAQNSQEKEHPSVDALDKTKSAENHGEIAEAPKKKVKKPKKKKEEATNPNVIFLDDSDKKVKDPNNAVGQFVEEDEEDEKKKKKKEKEGKEKKQLPKAPTPRSNRKENDAPKTEASYRGKRNKSERATRKEQSSSRQVEPKKKEERSQRVKKNAAVANNFRKDVKEGSQRVVRAKQSPSVNKVNTPVKQPSQQQPAAAPPPPVAPKEPVKEAPTLKGDKAAKEPTEGFFKTMYYKTRQKIAVMAKNPNTPPSSSSECDDTLVATDAQSMKTEVSAVYGLPVDYPKGVIPPRTDKSHPDKLFPGGRPFWMVRDEKPPQAKVIMISVVDACLKDGTIKMLPRQVPPDDFDPFCEDVQDLYARDNEYFKDNRRLLTNTVHNCCTMKAYGLGTLKVNKGSNRETPSSLKRTKFVAPTQCTVYTRKEHKKKQTVVKHPYTVGTRPRIIESKNKKKKNGSTASGRE